MAYGEEAKIGQWSLDKLAFLERYLPAYLRATRSALHKYYIDGFAGRGEWVNKRTGQKVAGSATIALQYAEQFTHLFFVEFEEERAENLRDLIRIHNASHKATVFVGDCNLLLSKVVKRIHPSAPSFAFLDPSSDQLQWKTIEMLSKWKTELFILFPLNMTLIRYLPKNGKITEWARIRLNGVFGTDEWEQLFQNTPRSRLKSELLMLYTNRLRSLGYEHVNISDVFKSDSGQKLYYMIWVGKHPIGKKIMDKVFEKQSDQLKLF